jgi:Dihaem cytochrome c
MSDRSKRLRKAPKLWRRRQQSVWVLLLLVGLSSLLGWGIQVQSAVGQSTVSQSTMSPATVSQIAQSQIAQTLPAMTGTVDAVPANLQLAQETYLARCATCHIAIPPGVLPDQSWKAILQDSNHYGVAWEQLRNPDLALTWKYLQFNSRGLNPDEPVPYRIARSRYFKILHPRVKFTEPVALGTCATCHVGAAKFDFRTLSPQWKNAS